MAEDDLDDLEEELAELEEELGDLGDEPADEPQEPVDPEPSEAEPDADEGGLVDRVRGSIPGGDDDAADADEAADEPPPEPPEDPSPSAAEAEEEPPWDREGDAWRAEGEPAGEETVIVRRLDADGNVVEEERASREAVPAGGGGSPPPDPNPSSDPDPEPGDEEDDEDRSWLVLLLVGILILGVVGAGVAYVALSDDDGGIGGTEGPTAAFTRSPSGTVATGTDVTFDASSSEVPEGASATYEWEFGDGATAEGQQTTHAFATAGTHEVTLSVTADGQTSSVTKGVTVVEAPEARIEVSVNGSQVGADNPVLAGDEVGLSGASSTAGGAIVSYSWSIDGSTADGAEVTTTFSDPGPHPVQLTVETDGGFTDTASVTVGVGYEAAFNDTLGAAVDGPSQGPPHNFTVGHGGLTASRVTAVLNYTTGTGGPLQDPTPARLNLTDGAGTVVDTAEGSGGEAVVEVSDPGSYAPGSWTARAEQDQGGAQKTYTLDVLVVYPTR